MRGLVRISLARIDRVQGDMGAAEGQLVAGLADLRASLGDSHPYTGYAIYELAKLYVELAEYQKAERLSVESLEMARKTMGDGHAEVLTSKQELAVIYRLQGRLEEAEELACRTLDQRFEHYPGSDFVPYNLNDIGQIYADQGRDDRAADYLEAAIDLGMAGQNPHFNEIALWRQSLARVYLRLGRCREAEALLLESRCVLANAFGEDHRFTQAVFADLADLPDCGRA